LLPHAEPVKLDDVTLDKLIATAASPVEALSKAGQEGAAALTTEAVKAVKADADHAVAAAKAEVTTAAAAAEQEASKQKATAEEALKAAAAKAAAEKAAGEECLHIPINITSLSTTCVTQYSSTPCSPCAWL
jgi:hypothetical protein